MYGYWNGEIVDDQKITISPLDIIVLRGYGVFDVMRTENNNVFNITKHWERFLNSAKILGLTIPVDFEQFQKILKDLTLKNNERFKGELNIRAVLTGGISNDGFHPQPGRECFFILCTPFVPLQEACYTKGVKIMTLEHKRDLPSAKITNYIKAIEQTKQKQTAEAFEILFVNKGIAYEASTSNIFFIKNGTLITSKKGILVGTTRTLTLELAKDLGILTEEREMTLREILEADEVFLTAVNKYIVPVIQIDDKTIASGKPGDITLKLLEAMKAYAKSGK